MPAPASQSASLLNFIRAHRPKKFDSSKVQANGIVTAWYLWNYEGADTDPKFAAYLKLTEIWGVIFPGSAERLSETCSCGNSAGHALGHGEVDQRLGVFDFHFVVTDQASGLDQPSEGPFHDLSFRKNLFRLFQFSRPFALFCG